MKKEILLLLGLMFGMAGAAEVEVKTVLNHGGAGPRIYKQPIKAKKRWRIGVIIPSLKDPFWHAVNYGVVSEAKRLGVSLRVMSAEGYTDLAGQNALFDKMSKEKLDIMIVALINPGRQNQKLEGFIKTKKIPVISFINPAKSNLISSRVETDYYDYGYKAAEHLAKTLKNRKKAKANVAVFPGPAKSGWADEIYNGFQTAASKYKFIDIKSVRWGDTSDEVQTKLIEKVLSKHKDINYIVGTPVAAHVAPAILKKAKVKASIITTYSNPEVYDLILSGKVLMSPTDHTALWARLAVDTAVDLLEKRKTYPVIGTRIKVLTKNNIKNFKYLDMFSPKKYTPILNVNW